MVATVGLIASGCAADGSDDRAAAAPGGEGTASYAVIADQIADYTASIAELAQLPAVAIGIITEDGLVETRALGVNHAGEAVTSETLFEIGSSTKAFLGLTEAMLVDRGELAWSDRVVDHYPAFELHDPWVTKEFRIDDLLAQRSGLPEYASEFPYAFGLSWAENVKGLKYVQPVASFRSAYAYQNMTHYVAGEIVAEKVGAATWNEAVGQLILDPLGMSSSGTSTDALAQLEDSTRGYTVRDGKAVERPLEVFPSVAEGAGSITSNLEDMAKWVSMHLAGGVAPGGSLISAEQLQRTYRPLIAVDNAEMLERLQLGTAEPNISYATGWFVHSLPEGRVIEHGGNTEGYNSAVMFDPDRGVGLVVLSNQGYQGGAASQIGKYGMDLLQGREPQAYFERWHEYQQQLAVEAEAADEAAKSAGTPAGHSVERYAGAYEHDLLGQLSIAVSGESLTALVGPKQFEATLERNVGHDFTISWQLSEGAPSTETYTLTFDGTGEKPDSLTIKGFVFDRVA